jgi:hypothetical protein
MCRLQFDILVKRIQYLLKVNSCVAISHFCTNECELIIMQFFDVCAYCLQFCDLYDIVSKMKIQELKIKK